MSTTSIHGQTMKIFVGPSGQAIYYHFLSPQKGSQINFYLAYIVALYSLHIVVNFHFISVSRHIPILHPTGESGSLFYIQLAYVQAQVLDVSPFDLMT